MLLRGKVALVAGAGRGRAGDIAVALAREGADLVMVTERSHPTTTVAGEIAALGRKALCLSADTRERTACDAVATRVTDIFGRVDALVDATATGGPAPAFDELDVRQWWSGLGADLVGTLQLTQALLPLLKVSGDSRVVLVEGSDGSSEALSAPAPGSPTASAASVWSRSVVTDALARELYPYGVRVNAVQEQPGWEAACFGRSDRALLGTNNNGHVSGLAAPGGDAGRERPVATTASAVRTPPAVHEDLAATVVFLASPLSRAVTGQTLRVRTGVVVG